MPELSPFAHQDEPVRRDLRQILEKVMGAVEPERAVRSHLEVCDGRFRIGDRTYDLESTNRIAVVGGGKAAVAMAREVERILDGRIDEGLVIAYDAGEESALERIRVAEGAHPVPDQGGVEAAGELLELVEGMGRDDLVICVVSGGGSSLMTLPAPGLELSELQKTTEVLLKSGMPIERVNAVRKHLSAIAGGRLAEAMEPAPSVSLVLSDVVGNRLDAIASGPTVADSTTFEDALDAVDAFNLGEKLPARVVEHLERGRRGEIEETPGAGHSCFERAEHFIVGDNDVACRAARGEAKRLGWNAAILTTHLEGEAREVGEVAVGLGREVAGHRRPVQPPGCLILGGETTVTVRGRGRGGRNKELVLGGVAALCEDDEITIASFATDGIDGPTESAGAVADCKTLEVSESKGLNPADYLRENDSQAFFEETGDVLVTGPTGTNVNDVVLVFVEDSGDIDEAVDDGRGESEDV